MSSSHPYRVLTAEWCHETNTFSPFLTNLQNFTEQYLYRTADEIRKERYGTASVIGATYEAADEYGWELFPVICASANPSGKVTSETFESLAEQIVTTAESLHQQVNGLDGILLHLHGAMVSEKYEDAEGELIRRLRHVLDSIDSQEQYHGGRKTDRVPIVVTLDLHGNISPSMAKDCATLLAVRTYPHVDYYPISQRAAKFLQQTMTGEIRPITVLSRRPLLRGLDFGKTYDGSPMKTLIDRCIEMETDGSILLGSPCAGFLAADVKDIGPSITITVDINNKKHHLHHDNEEEDEVLSSTRYAEKIAHTLADYIWETRDIQAERHLTLTEAGDLAKSYHDKAASTLAQSLKDTPSGQFITFPKPLVLADVSDNPGSGHYGDATNLLSKLLDSGVKNAVFYAIYDPEAAIAAQKLGVGNEGTLKLGGWHSEADGGPPLHLKGRVVSLTDGCFSTYGPMGFGGVMQNMGLSAVFRVANTSFDIVIITNNAQLLDDAQITSMGICPAQKHVIAVKSKYHFRACLSPIAGEIYTVDGGGLGSSILSGGVYYNVRRPIYPLDEVNL